MRKTSFVPPILALLLFLSLVLNFLQRQHTDHQHQVILALQNANTISTQLYTITAYTTAKDETNGDGRTALLEKPISGWTCAVSRDLMDWLGGTVYIQDVGVRRVNDLMHSRYEKSVDVFCGNKYQAIQFGRQKKRVTFLGR